MHARSIAALALTVSASWTVGAAQPRRPESVPPYAAEIRRTAYGVPHVKAADYAGLGFGIGYASAEDNLCDLAERILTVTATRARHLGPGAEDANVVSDLHHQRVIQSGELDNLGADAGRRGACPPRAAGSTPPPPPDCAPWPR